jgi:hypothetical protein
VVERGFCLTFYGLLSDLSGSKGDNLAFYDLSFDLSGCKGR